MGPKLMTFFASVGVNYAVQYNRTIGIACLRINKWAHDVIGVY